MTSNPMTTAKELLESIITAIPECTTVFRYTSGSPELDVEKFSKVLVSALRQAQESVRPVTPVTGAVEYKGQMYQWNEFDDNLKKFWEGVE